MSYRPLPPFVTIESSSIEGLGLFATREIKKGTELGLSHVLCDGVLYRTPLGGFVNHSETPNCERVQVNNKSYLKTLEDIFPNTELTLKYTMYKPIL